MKKSVVNLLAVTAMVFSCTQLVSADSQHLFTGGLDTASVANLTYATLGSPSSTYSQSILFPASNNWNNISTKVKLSYTGSGKLTLAVGSTSTNGLLGRMFPYYRNWLGQIVEDTSLNSTWVKTDAYGYENQMNAFSMTTTQKISNFTHEVGHALSLAHVQPSEPVYAVMKQGIQGLGPQTTDKNHLKEKWGN